MRLLVLFLIGALKLPGQLSFAVLSQQAQSSSFNIHWAEKLNDLADRGDVQAALEELRKLLPRAPSKQLKRLLYNTGIKACANAGNLEKAELIFSEMLEQGIAPNRKGFGKMIEAAASTGNLSAAEDWFRRSAGLCGAEAVDFNLLIQAAAKARNAEAAGTWFQELLWNDIQPDKFTLRGLLEACSSTGDVARATSFMAKWKSLGLQVTDEHRAALRKVYVKNNDLQAVEEQIRKLEKPGLKDYGMVVDAAARCGNLTAAEFWFQEAEAAGIQLRNDVILVTLMFAAARAADLDRCEHWFRAATEAGLQPNGAMYTALVTAAAESLDLVAAEHWLRLCRAELGSGGSEEATNAALRAAGLRGDLEKAEKWAEILLEDGRELDGYSYRALLTAAARARNTVAAQRWFRRATMEGEVELSTCNAAIQAAARAGDTGLAQEMLQEMRALDVRPDQVSYIGLLTSASNARNLAAAEAFLAEAKADGLGKAAIYAPVISCAAKSGNVAIAEKWFLEAEKSGAEMDINAFNAIIAAVARVGNLAAAQRWLQRAQEAGEEPDLITYTSLISAAAKKRDLKAAQAYMREAIEKGLKPDIVMMNSIISAAAKIGDLKTAENVFQQALEAGLEPTVVTFSTLITAAMKADDLELAESWLQKCRDFGLPQGAALITPFIAFAARQRDLQLAESWFDRMVAGRIQPDMVVYGTLISAAQKAGEGKAADAWLQRALQDGVRLDKNCFGIAVSALANGGALELAVQRLDEMRQFGFPPEARQINAVLKPISYQTGAFRDASAQQILERIVAWRVRPDEMSYRYLTRCLGEKAVKQAASEHQLSFKGFETAARHSPKIRQTPDRPKQMQRQKKPTSQGQQRIYLRGRDKPP